MRKTIAPELRAAETTCLLGYIHTYVHVYTLHAEVSCCYSLPFLPLPTLSRLKVHLLDKPRLSQAANNASVYWECSFCPAVRLTSDCLQRVFFLSCQYSPGDRQVTVYCQCSFCPAVRKKSDCLLRVFFRSCQYSPVDRQLTVYCECSFCPASIHLETDK